MRCRGEENHHSHGGDEHQHAHTHGPGGTWTPDEHGHTHEHLEDPGKFFAKCRMTGTLTSSSGSPAISFPKEKSNFPSTERFNLGSPSTLTSRISTPLANPVIRHFAKNLPGSWIFPWES
jgi:hypothetical protein